MKSDGELAARLALLERELAEARAQQAATSDILRVISRSAVDVDAVLSQVIRSGIELCDAARGVIWLIKDGLLCLAAHVGYAPEWVEFALANPLVPAADSATISGIAAFTGEILNVEDIPSDPRFRSFAGHSYGNYRAGLAVPLKRDGIVAGVIALSRPEARRYTDRQVALVQTFADQAVIAIENARLFAEVETKTQNLTEALQQQTATSDVLKVISRSTFDLHVVLDTLVASATALCDAEQGIISLFEGDAFRAYTVHPPEPEFLAFLRARPQRLTDPGLAPRVARAGGIVHIPDKLLDPDYATIPGATKFSDTRTLLGVPLLREGKVVGVFALMRFEARPFTQRQIDLVQTFADQAAIAIENVRLFEEVQSRNRDLTDSLERQTAMSEILRVISRSPNDLAPVFQVIAESAAKLCNARFSVVYRFDGDLIHFVAQYGLTADAIEAEHRAFPMRPGRASAAARVILTADVVQIPDVTIDPDYQLGETARVLDARSTLAVPMLRDGRPVGSINVARAETGAFPERQIELLRTFADQAVIAVANVQLFEALQARTQELARSLEELRTAQDRLVQTEKLASLGQLTAGIAHEIKNPLNFVNNFAALSGELLDELNEALSGASLDPKTAETIEEVTGLLKGNLDKVVEHGKRADSIIRNMLLHSRTGSGERRPSAINDIVEEALNLAYHGARAERPGFNVTLERTLDPAAGEIDVYPQEITRVLLNLVANGFYATVKRREREGEGYEPMLSAATRSLGDRVEIRIRDNGTGIPKDVRDKMFDPFFTTKPAGEGTGLGLSLSHDIVVKQHGGTIQVETEPGSYTEFRLVLPRGAASAGGEP
ncbi:MAG: GAF domain-containing protein [Hyphomicrobiales bacterium]